MVEMIKPVADRYDWEIDWAMDSVSFVNKNFEDVSECKTVCKLKADVQKITDDIYPQSRCSPLWDVLGSLRLSGCYHHSRGQSMDWSWDDRIRKQVKRR